MLRTEEQDGPDTRRDVEQDEPLDVPPAPETPTLVDRVKGWLSFAVDSVADTVSTPPSETELELTDKKTDPVRTDDIDPQLSGLADALEIDIFSPSEMSVPDSQNITADDATEQSVFDLPLTIARLEELLPPRNRGGVLPTLRFPAPRVGPPMTQWSETETVRIATAIDDIATFLLDSENEDVGSPTIVAQVQLQQESDALNTDPLDDDESEGKVGRLLGKLFWWRADGQEAEQPELPEMLTEVTEPIRQVHPEPEVIVIRSIGESEESSSKADIPSIEEEEGTAATPFVSKSDQPSALRDLADGLPPPDVFVEYEPEAAATNDPPNEQPAIVAPQSESPNTTELVESSDDKLEPDLWARFSSL